MAAISGRRTRPKAGSNIPAAIGSAIALYPTRSPPTPPGAGAPRTQALRPTPRPTTEHRPPHRALAAPRRPPIADLAPQARPGIDPELARAQPKRHAQRILLGDLAGARADRASAHTVAEERRTPAPSLTQRRLPAGREGPGPSRSRNPTAPFCPRPARRGARGRGSYHYALPRPVGRASRILRRALSGRSVWPSPRRQSYTRGSAVRIPRVRVAGTRLAIQAGVLADSRPAPAAGPC